MVREWLSTVAITYSRMFGRLLGCELVVETSDHSLETSMELPNKDDRAWDGSLYKSGQLYHAGYANPIKPEVDHNPKLEDPDSIETRVGGDSDSEDGSRVELISSSRYRSYMHQDLISQLLNPREQWRLLVYAVIALGGLQLVGVMISLYNSGAF